MLFAREGAAVACVDIDARMGEETAAMIRDEGGDAAFIERFQVLFPPIPKGLQGELHAVFRGVGAPVASKR